MQGPDLISNSNLKLLKLYPEKISYIFPKKYSFSKMDADQAINLYPLVLWDVCWFSLFSSNQRVKSLFDLAWKTDFLTKEKVFILTWKNRFFAFK